MRASIQFERIILFSSRPICARRGGKREGESQCRKRRVSGPYDIAFRWGWWDRIHCIKENLLDVSREEMLQPENSVAAPQSIARLWGQKSFIQRETLIDLVTLHVQVTVMASFFTTIAVLRVWISAFECFLVVGYVRKWSYISCANINLFRIKREDAKNTIFCWRSNRPWKTWLRVSAIYEDMKTLCGT